MGTPHTAGSDALATLELFFQAWGAWEEPCLRHVNTLEGLSGSYEMYNPKWCICDAIAIYIDMQLQFIWIEAP